MIEERKHDDARPVPLPEIIGQIAGPMQGILAGLARSILDEQRNHAARVADLEVESAKHVEQIHALRVATTALGAEAEALRADRNAMHDEIDVLRRQNAALLDERRAQNDMIAAVERYAEAKRRVEALLVSLDGVAKDAGVDGEGPLEAAGRTDGEATSDTMTATEQEASAATCAGPRQVGGSGMATDAAAPAPCLSAPADSVSPVSVAGGTGVDAEAGHLPGRKSIQG